MLLVSGKDIEFKYPNQVESLLEGLSFTVGARSRIGLVGDNGCGKTTLFRLLRGELEPGAGSISFQGVSRIGYLPQELSLDEGITLFDYLWSVDPELHGIKVKLDGFEDRADPAYGDLVNEFHARGGYRFESRFERVLSDFELDESGLPMHISNLSGGEKTKIALSRMILEEPSFMLLDEPTNHLEIAVLEWLENYLGHCSIPFVVISHDRRFLDNCVATIWEMTDRTIRVFSGNWTFYGEEKRRETERRKHLHETQRKKIGQLRRAARQRRDWAASHQAETRPGGGAPVYESVTNFARRSMKRARNVEKRIRMMIEREEAKRPFIEKERKLSLSTSGIRNRIVLEIRDLGKSFGPRTVFQGFSLAVRNGARLGIIGRNGSGKSTILRIITGIEESSRGRFHWAPAATFAYYAQEHENLEPSMTVLEEVLQGRIREQTEARNILGCLNIRGEMVDRRIDTLSLGERSKAALARIIFSDSNVLVLDEPTNHFELKAREAFEEALTAYGGTVLLVTHDRYLLGKIVTEIYDMDRGRHYDGTYAEYAAALSSTGGS